MPHPAMSPDNVAVITGGASGIGLAAAMRFAGLGMKVCIADIGADRLERGRDKTVIRRHGRRRRCHDRGRRRQPLRRRGGTGSRRAEAVRRHRHPDEQCRHRPGQQQLRPAGELAAHSRRQSLGRHPRHAGLCASHDRTRAARPHHQHRLQAGHHHPARQSRLQRLQGRREGASPRRCSTNCATRRAARSARI